MLSAQSLSFLCCPSCSATPLDYRGFEASPDGELLDAVVWCSSCRSWFPVEGGILELLIGDLAYADDRRFFFRRHASELEELGLAPPVEAAPRVSELQRTQQAHFDWYVANDRQSYLTYEQMPFWLATDTLVFSSWRELIAPGGVLLDVGCGNGRSTYKLMDLDLDILAFDVSKAAVKQAAQRFREGHFKARPTFFVSDATRFPIRSGVMNYVLVYGVLHHLPDPQAACREIARVLRPGGMLFVSENNNSVFRRPFDWLQKLKPLWYEEAGPAPLLSARVLREALGGVGIAVRTSTSVFMPPHLVNLLGFRSGCSLLRITDRLASLLPGLKGNGGLVTAVGKKLA